MHSPLVIIKTEAVMTIVVQTVFRPRGLILLLALCSLINLGHTKQQRQKGKNFFITSDVSDNDSYWWLSVSTEKYLLTFRNIMAQSVDSVLKSIIQNINKINLLLVLNLSFFNVWKKSSCIILLWVFGKVTSPKCECFAKIRSYQQQPLAEWAVMTNMDKNVQFKTST